MNLPDEWIEAGLAWGDLGFTPKQAAALALADYAIAVLPVRVVEEPAVAK